ncbi:MAG TPA: glycosyltransferase 87 family protein [Fimbriiglobus sp.]|nr:glycosyltransferase 87 family protein [Fimbriiglobus sp.]
MPVAGGLLIAAILGWLGHRFYTDPTFLPPDDFTAFWGAGRVHGTGGDPYDGEQLFPIQKAAGWDRDRPNINWVPPWGFTVFTPFGMLPARTAQLLWLVGQAAVIVGCAAAAWRAYGGAPRLQGWAAAAALAFFPAMYLLRCGQNTGWVLLGLTGLLVASATGRPWLAGLAALVALKPHMFVPLWVVLALDATRSRRSAALLGWGVLVGAVMTVAPLAVNPDVWGQYFDTLARPQSDSHPALSGWQPPLIGYYARAAIDPTKFWIQAVPTAIALAATPIYWWWRRHRWDWPVELARLVPVGLIAAPYGAWPYDQIVLLIPLAAIAARLARFGTRTQIAVAAAVYVACDGVALASRAAESFVWTTPAVLLGYLLVERYVGPERKR